MRKVSLPLRDARAKLTPPRLPPTRVPVPCARCRCRAPRVPVAPATSSRRSHLPARAASAARATAVAHRRRRRVPLAVARCIVEPHRHCCRSAAARVDARSLVLDYRCAAPSPRCSRRRRCPSPPPRPARRRSLPHRPASPSPPRSALPNRSRGCPRKVCKVSGLEPTVGGQCGQVAQFLRAKLGRKVG